MSIKHTNGPTFLALNLQSPPESAHIRILRDTEPSEKYYSRKNLDPDMPLPKDVQRKTMLLKICEAQSDLEVKPTYF